MPAAKAQKNSSAESLVRGGPTLTAVFICLFFQFIRGKKIKVPLKTGHHRPANETQFNDVSLAG